MLLAVSTDCPAPAKLSQSFADVVARIPVIQPLFGCLYSWKLVLAPMPTIHSASDPQSADTCGSQLVFQMPELHMIQYSQKWQAFVYFRTPQMFARQQKQLSHLHSSHQVHS